MRKFHIIHPVLVYQNSRSPDPRSRFKDAVFTWSISMPP